ncbi:sororin isoform X3 [Erinaceus europaeus]|uniref:Sororin isoform X3 n=1 Tax=Erinaceus europaeus TaxID=9365 RepID=A0ABM3W678_ERIEU|nr:sororin isoform X3 [Erinaceus europaeus]
MAGRRARSGGATRRSGPGPTSSKCLRSSLPKSGCDLQSSLPEIWPKAPRDTPARKPIILKKIVAHTVQVRAGLRGCGRGAVCVGGAAGCDLGPLSPQIPSACTPRRSPRIAFFLEKENKPPYKELTRGDLFKTRDVPVTPASSPVPNAPSSADPNSGYREPDARDLEMSRKVRRSYSRLEAHTSASTSTPGRRSCFGFEGLLAADDLAGVSPVVTSKITEAPVLPERPSVPDTTLPGISPPVTKEKRKKKKAPELLKSELDEWAAAMNAEFEAAEQFDLLVE